MKTFPVVLPSLYGMHALRQLTADEVDEVFLHPLTVDSGKAVFNIAVNGVESAHTVTLYSSGEWAFETEVAL